MGRKQTTGIYDSRARLEEEIIQRWKAGVIYRQIAVAVGVSFSVVRDIVCNHTPRKKHHV